MGNLFRTGGGGGKIKRTQVFSGASDADHDVDMTGYEGWQNFTLENFVITNMKLVMNNQEPFSDISSVSVLDSYDSLKGILHLKTSSYGNYYFNQLKWFIEYTVDLIQN